MVEYKNSKISIFYEITLQYKLQHVCVHVSPYMFSLAYTKCFVITGYNTLQIHLHDDAKNDVTN